MAEVKILELPGDEERFYAPLAGTSIDDGIWVTPSASDGLVIIAAGTDRPVGVVVEAPGTEFPQKTLLVLGEGALLDLGTNITAAAPGTVFFSDGDGTISSSEPNPGAGTDYYSVGYIEADEDGSATTTRLRVKIQEIRDAVA